MRDLFRDTLTRLRRSWRRWRAAAGASPDAGSRRRVDARARFWAELREGQREAAAHVARDRS